MRRTLAILLTLGLVGFSAVACLAEQKEEKRPVVIVHVDGVASVTIGKVLSEVAIDKEDLVQIIPTVDPEKVLLRGTAPGKGRLSLKDKDKNVEVLDVIVRRLVELPVGAEDYLELPKKQPIQKIVNQDDKIAKVSAVPGDASRVRIDTLRLGKTLCLFTSNDAKEEAYDILVLTPDRTIVVGQAQTFRPSSGKAIKWIILTDDRVATVKDKEGTGKLEHYRNFGNEVSSVAKGEVTAVSISGLRVGVTRLTIRDIEDKDNIIALGVMPKK